MFTNWDIATLLHILFDTHLGGSQLVWQFNCLAVSVIPHAVSLLAQVANLIASLWRLHSTAPRPQHDEGYIATPGQCALTIYNDNVMHTTVLYNTIQRVLTIYNDNVMHTTVPYNAIEHYTTRRDNIQRQCTCDAYDSTVQHYNTIQRVLTIYNDNVMHTTVPYNAIEHYTTLYNTIQHDTTLSQHYTTRYNTLQHATTRYNTQQHDTTRYNTLQHATTRYNTLQYDTKGHANTIPSRWVKIFLNWIWLLLYTLYSLHVIFYCLENYVVVMFHVVFQIEYHPIFCTGKLHSLYYLLLHPIVDRVCSGACCIMTATGVSGEME